MKVPSLKAFIAKCKNDRDKYDRIGDAIWQGIIAAAEHQLQVQKTWRTGKGKWYATAMLTKCNERINAGSSEEVEQKECDGKDAAVTACRELLAKHAGYFSDRTTVEVELRPEIA